MQHARACSPLAATNEGELLEWLLAAQCLYSEDIEWSVPARTLVIRGREQVIDHLVAEARAMRSAELTVLRRFAGERQMVDEYAVRFLYDGGLEDAPILAGDLVELKRVRILDLIDGRAMRETCIETWTVLPRALPDGRSSPSGR
jgi:hypothetical protein